MSNGLLAPLLRNDETQEAFMDKTYVLTGATSGFGAATLKLLSKKSERSIIVGARDVARVSNEYGDQLRVLPLDLAVLGSVREFCAALKGVPIDLLGMNAGMQTRTLKKTIDGFETTFQSNYLSHFLMFNLLKDQLTENSIIVTTGSGTHDPDEKTPVPPPKHANVEWLAYPERHPKPEKFGPARTARAYSTSKLLCILMAKEIANRFPHLRAVSFDPGYLPDTKLSREYPALLTAVIKRIIPLLMKNDRSGSVATTAPEYLRVLLGELAPAESGGYIVMRSGKGVEAIPSELARTPGMAERVWEESIYLLNLDV